MDTGWDLPICTDINAPLVTCCIGRHFCIRCTLDKLRRVGQLRVVNRVDFCPEGLCKLRGIQAPFTFEFGISVAEDAGAADGSGCVESTGRVGVEGGQSWIMF